MEQNILDPFGIMAKLSWSALAASILFGIFGWYFIKQGRRRGQTPPIFTGIAMMIYPNFIDNSVLIWGVGFALLWFGFKQIKG